jgi:hypothetical protein
MIVVGALLAVAAKRAERDPTSDWQTPCGCGDRLRHRRGSAALRPMLSTW